MVFVFIVEDLSVVEIYDARHVSHAAVADLDVLLFNKFVFCDATITKVVMKLRIVLSISKGRGWAE